MNKKKLDILNVVLSKTFNKKINLKLTSKKSEIDGWDSLADVRIILILEKKFNLKININKFIGSKNIKDILNIL
jgi:acyl carrier protein